jgi:hypothetical protein
VGERNIWQWINRIEEGEDHAARRAPRRNFRPEVEDGLTAGARMSVGKSGRLGTGSGRKGAGP